MPPCGNCQEWVLIRLPQNTWFLWLSRTMPTLGLNPSRSSIINLDSCVDRLLHRHDTSQTSRPPGAPIGAAGGPLAPLERPQRISATMKASQFFISTLKEAPADAEVASHRLML